MTTRRKAKQLIMALRSERRGFTLVELLVNVGILGIISGLMMTGLFQSLGVTRFWSDDVKATHSLRQAMSVIATDTLSATATDLVDGATAVDSLTLDWVDGSGSPQTATYGVSGSNLTKTIDGNQIILSRNVVAVSFALAGSVFSFDAEVDAELGTTETMSLQTYLRNIP